MSNAILLVVVATVLQAGGDPPKSGWKTFQSPEGKFSILMPGEPQKTVLRTPTDYGPSEVTWYIYKGRTGALSASFMDYPEAAANVDRATLMENGIVGAVRKLRGKLISERKVKAGDQPGREWIVEIPPGMHQAIPNGGIYRVRGFQVGRRLYQVVAAVPQELADSRDINRFLASFKLTDARKADEERPKDGDDGSKKKDQTRKR